GLPTSPSLPTRRSSDLLGHDDGDRLSDEAHTVEGEAIVAVKLDGRIAGAERVLALEGKGGQGFDEIRERVAGEAEDDARKGEGRSEEHTSELQSRENLV